MENKFRTGIFSLRTRRLGTVAEIMIKKLYGFSNPLNKYHDLYNTAMGERIEVKFSTATRKNEIEIREDNVIAQCIEANELSKRVISLSEVTTAAFDSNIQQVEPSQFEVLYYGLFFYDCVQIYQVKSADVASIQGWSGKQHAGNIGEGQFHMNNKTFLSHQKYLIKQLSYKELYNLLK